MQGLSITYYGTQEQDAQTMPEIKSRSLDKHNKITHKCLYVWWNPSWPLIKKIDPIWPPSPNPGFKSKQILMEIIK